MVANVVLNGALRRRAEELDIVFLEGVAVNSFKAGPGSVAVALANGRVVDRVAAGRRRRRQIADARHGRHQDSVVGLWPVGHRLTVIHERPHNGRADEHFLPAGPFASVRCRRDQMASTARQSCGRSAPMTLRELSPRTILSSRQSLNSGSGSDLGEIRVEGGRRAWPLGLTLARSFHRAALCACRRRCTRHSSDRRPGS